METLGRREANKLATRAALQTAARDLFAGQGYEATSVRDITTRAGVGERTFYRYFESKDDLLAGEIEEWLRLLADAIEAQPSGLVPLAAVRDGVIVLAEQIGSGAHRRPFWLLSERPRPMQPLRDLAPRPLVRFEQAIANALIARGQRLGEPLSAELAELVARVSVGAMRSAIVRERRRRGSGSNDAPATLVELLREAFAQLSAQAAGMR